MSLWHPLASISLASVHLLHEPRYLGEDTRLTCKLLGKNSAGDIVLQGKT